MYQVTWSKPQSMPAIGHNFVDTWAEVIDWIAEGTEGLDYWTVSVVCDGSNPEHVEFYPTDTLEKGNLMDNLVKMLPDMAHGEVSASLMNFASAYWEPEEMVTGFKMLAYISEGVVTGKSELSKAKRRMN